MFVTDEGLSLNDARLVSRALFYFHVHQSEMYGKLSCTALTDVVTLSAFVVVKCSGCSMTENLFLKVTKTCW